MSEQKLRDLILQSARETEGVGAVEETRKWGQPSFAPAKANVGSSVRIQGNDDGTQSLMFICTTGLVDTFREQYADTLDFVGNREIKLAGDDLGEHRDALKHCIALALTHKLRKKSKA